MQPASCNWVNTSPVRAPRVLVKERMVSTPTPSTTRPLAELSTVRRSRAYSVSTPFRAAVTRTAVPSSPAISAAGSSSWEKGTPFTATNRSPGRMPASAAGEPSTTCTTKKPPSACW